MRVIVQDTREQKDKHKHVEDKFLEMGYKVVRSKLYCGDYTYLDNQTICVDTKKDIQEIVGNVTTSHKRFTDEIKRAIDNDIKLIFLINDDEISELSEVINWVNPRKKYINKKATDGKTLYKILSTIEDRYSTKFYFCKKEETAQKIIELLGE